MIRSGPLFFWPRAARTLLAASVAGALSACGLTGGHAPVENRLPGRTAPVRLVDPATLPGAEFAGKPGYYTVQPGDTIRSISRALNVDWRDLAQWNSAWVANPDTIEVGQVFTIEPGCYVIDALVQPLAGDDRRELLDWRAVDALRSFGGVRIEDNVVVTADGHRNLTRDAWAVAS